MTEDPELRSMKGRFSAAAATYDVLATAQASAARRLTDFMPDDVPARILEVGCGTGILTALLLAKYEDQTIYAIDAADRMVQHARARFEGESRIQWYVADLVNFHPAIQFPLIVSNSSLHWLPNLRDGIAHLASLLSPNGQLVFAIMLYGTLGELHSARLRVAPHKPPLQRLPIANEVGQCLELAGLRILRTDTEEYKATYRGGAAFLRSLHDQGLTGGSFSRSMLPLTRREIEELIREYEKHYSTEPGTVYATYKVLFVQAAKSED